MSYRSRISSTKVKKFGGKPSSVKLHKESNKYKVPPRNYEFVVVQVSNIERQDLAANGRKLWPKVKSQLVDGVKVYNYFADVTLEFKSAVFLVKRIEGVYQKPELTVVCVRKEGKLSWLRVPEHIKE